jgi:hypothetical protein
LIYFVPVIAVADVFQRRVESVSGLPVAAICKTTFTGFNIAETIRVVMFGDKSVYLEAR